MIPDGVFVCARLSLLLLAPAQFAAVAVYVAVFAAEFAALVTRGGIVSAVEIASQLAAVVGDLSLVVTDVAACAAVAIPGKGGGHTQSHQQENSSYRAFHDFVLRAAIGG
jgi:hypothetical protein